MSKKSKKLSYAKVCLETIRAFNRACRPIVGRNVLVYKNKDIVLDVLTGELIPITGACKRAVCVARKMHRHFYEDNALRKKWHDAMYHYWTFIQYDEEAEELVRNTDLTPLFQHKQSGRGLYISNLTHTRSGHADKTTY